VIKQRIDLHITSKEAIQANQLSDDESRDGTDSDEILSLMHTDKGYDNPANDELDMYLSDHSTSGPLLFWEDNKKRYQRLYVLHPKNHCVPATSAAAEAGYIASARIIV
jgi:hypothetical protein